ncbi:MAG: hypothetical protein A07HR60_01927 [uncultured archaeon A07HR60]|nr:MAG: hypothetical protein A07HR60_01927 [uncultured archaeon A07HR60]
MTDPNTENPMNDSDPQANPDSHFDLDPDPDADPDSRSEADSTTAHAGNTGQTPTDGGRRPSDSPDGSGLFADTGSDRLRWLVDRALLVAFSGLALLTAIQFYLQMGAAIDTWVAPAYQPIVSAGVNLSVLLVAVAGVSRQLRRLVAG